MAKNIDIKLSFDGSDAIRGTQKLEDSFAGVNQEAEKTQDTLNKSSQKLAQNSKAAVDANKKQIKSINTLQKELKEFTIARNKATDPKQIKEFNKEIENTTGEIKKLNGEIEKTGGDKKAAGGIFGRLKNFFTSIPGLVTIGIGAVTLLATKVFNIQKDIQKQQSIAKTLFGSDADFRAITSNARRLASVYDKDVNEVLKSANVLTKQFGVGQQEAFDLIQEGIAKGADLNGDFLDQISEYSTQFRSAGLEADEAIAIITQSVKEGVFSDKGADSIKEATIRLREFTPATRDAIKAVGLDADQVQKDLASGAKTYFQVIQEVVGATKEFGQNSAEAGQVLADVFGGAGEDAGDFIFKLDEISTNLGDIEDNTGGLEKASNELSAAWSNFTTSIFESDNVLGQFIAGALDAVSNLLEDIITLTESAEKAAAKTLSTSLSSTTKLLQDNNKIFDDVSKKTDEQLKNFKRQADEAILSGKTLSKEQSKQLRAVNQILDGQAEGLDREAIALARQKNLRGDAAKQILDLQKLLEKSQKEGNKIRSQELANEIGFLQANIDVSTQQEDLIKNGDKLNNTRISGIKRTDAEIKKAAQNREKNEGDLQKEITALVDEGEKARRDIALENLTGEERILKELEFASEEIDILEATLKEKNNKYAASDTIRIENEKKINTAIANLNQELLDETGRQLQEQREKDLQEEIKAQQTKLGVKKQLASQEVAILNELISINDESTEEGVKEEIFLLEQKQKLLDKEVEKKVELLKLDLLKKDITDDEKELINNQIELLELKGEVQSNNIDKAINALESGANQLEGFDKFLGDIFGLDDQSKIDGIKQQFSILTSELVNIYTSSIDSQLEQNQRIIDNYDTSIDSLNDKLNQEIELAKLGEANNVTAIKSQIEQEEKAREDALAKQAELQKRQEQLDKAAQVSSLITASANILKGFSTLPIVGQILGVAAVGALFAGFISAQSQAKALSTQFEEGGLISVDGSNTKVVKGNRHSQGGEALLSHAEVEDGEMLAVLNRNATTQNKEKFTTFVNKLNAGRSFDDLMTTRTSVNLNKPNELMANNVLTNNVDFSKTNSKLDMIYNVLKDKGEISETKTHYVRKKGSTITKVKK